jgi:hypothetical protein
MAYLRHQWASSGWCMDLRCAPPKLCHPSRSGPATWQRESLYHLIFNQHYFNVIFTKVTFLCTGLKKELWLWRLLLTNCVLFSVTFINKRFVATLDTNLFLIVNVVMLRQWWGFRCTVHWVLYVEHLQYTAVCKHQLTDMNDLNKLHDYNWTLIHWRWTSKDSNPLNTKLRHRTLIQGRSFQFTLPTLQRLLSISLPTVHCSFEWLLRCFPTTHTRYIRHLNTYIK